MSALPPKADIRRHFFNVCFVPIADIDEITLAKQKDRLAAVSPKSDQVFFFRLIALAHNAAFRHTAGLAVDNGATSRRHDNRTSDRAHDATPRHSDGLAIDYRVGRHSTHGYSGERYECRQCQSNARQTDDANHCVPPLQLDTGPHRAL
jgi:hypothetical protein